MPADRANITVLGYTGREPEPARTDDYDENGWRRHDDPWTSWQLARIHRSLAPQGKKADTAKKAASEAIAAVDTAWDKLTTASNWMAAHHTYVVAVDAARNAINAWGTAVWALGAAWPSGDPAVSEYKERVSREAAWLVPTADDLYERERSWGYDLPDEARSAMADLDRQYEKREKLARQTLGILGAGSGA